MLQLTSLAMVSAFFALLARANPRPELRWWTRAWVANLVALAVTVDLVAAAVPIRCFRSITILYIAGKTAFAAAPGAGRVDDDPAGRAVSSRPGSWRRRLAIYSIGAADRVARPHLGGDRAAFVHGRAPRRAGVHALAFGRRRRHLADRRHRGARCAGARRGGCLRPSMAATGARPGRGPGSIPPARSCRRAPRFDMGAEWLVVLGSVLAVSERGRRALEASHHRLVLAQDDLRQLADRDPLTGAINRRALRDIFNDVQTVGRDAAVLRSRRLQADQRSAWSCGRRRLPADVCQRAEGIVPARAITSFATAATSSWSSRAGSTPPAPGRASMTSPSA